MTRIATEYPSSREANFTLAILVAAYVLSLLDRLILSLLVGPVRQSLHISDFQVSLLQGVAFAVFYAVLGLPIGRLADRFNRKIIIAGGIFLWGIMTAACGLARTFETLFIARIGVAVGEAALSPAAYSLLSDAFPPARLPRAIAMYTLGSTIGTGTAYIIGGSALAAMAGAQTFDLPLLGQRQSWQLAFMIVGLPALMMTPLVLLVREPPRHGLAIDTSLSPMTWREIWRYMRAHKGVYISIFAGISCLASVGYGYLSWYPTFLMRTYSIPPHRAGLVFGGLFLLFGSVGAYGSARLSEFLAQRGFTDATLRTALIAAIGLIPMGAGTLMPSATLALAISAPTFILLNAYYGVGVASLQLITPNRMRAVVSALFFLASTLVGLGLGASFVAALTDFVFRDDLALRFSLTVLTSVGAPLAALALWLGLRPYRTALQAQA